MIIKPTPSQLRACARWNWEKAQLAKKEKRQSDHDRLLKQAISLGHQARATELRQYEVNKAHGLVSP